MTPEKDPHQFIECSCGHEVIQATHDVEIDQFYMSFFAYGHHRVHDWGWRLRHIWRILTRGTPYADSVVLTREEAKNLAVFLTRPEPEKSAPR